MAQQSDTEPRPAPKTQGRATHDLQQRIINKQENTKGTDAPLPGETCRVGVGSGPRLCAKPLKFMAICSGGRKFDERSSARTAPTGPVTRRRGNSRPRDLAWLGKKRRTPSDFLS